MMKHLYTLATALLIGSSAMLAQDDGYQPLVREGVRWVNTIQWIDMDYEGPIETYSLWFEGDTVIATNSGTHTYKILKGKQVNYLRESQKIIYRINQQEISVAEQLGELPQENLLYDFSGRNEAFLHDEHTTWKFDYVGTTIINGHQCRVFQDNDHDPSIGYYSVGFLIESIGFVSDTGDGDLISIRWDIIPGGCMYWQLHHLEDLDGNLIFDPRQPFVSVEGIGADDATASDDRYYNTLGQPFDHKPTTPGIYVHRGKKNIIK